MNALNYGSLEACKKLVDAGIVLETEKVWSIGGMQSILVDKSEFIRDGRWSIPALSMAEAWRELPKNRKLKSYNGSDGYSFWYDYEEGVFCDINPTDAIIHLLIWVKGQKGKEK